MPQKKKKPIKSKKKKTTNEIKLNPKYYDELHSEEIYSEETRVGKIFGARQKDTGEEFIQLKGKSKMPWGWQYNQGFSIRQPNYLTKLINSLRKVANRIGWKIENKEEDIEKIKSKIREQQEVIIELEKANDEARKSHNFFIKELKKKQELLIKNNAKDFLNKIDELRQKIKDSERLSESDLQDFLYNNSWMFGVEYINTEPQKLRGAHSKFDFYLERYNLTNDIVEIKLISDQIINKDGSISAKVIQAVDQIIEYMESSQAVAHSSVLSDEEGIKELRPRGIVIIGKDVSKEAIIKIRKWNYQLSHIKIMTYNDILKKSEVFGNYIKKIIQVS